jgi:hypothetical protein
LPLDIDTITQEVMEIYDPNSPKGLRDALDKVYAYRLENRYTREELFELKDRLLEEASRLADEQRGSREDIRRIPSEDLAWRMFVIENANAARRVLESTAGRELSNTSGEEAE